MFNVLETVETFFSRLGPAVRQLVGSRFFSAFSGVSFVAFFAAVLYAPTRFPPIAPLSPTLWGLAPAPPELFDNAQVQEKAHEFADKGVQYAPEAMQRGFTAFKTVFFHGDTAAATMSLNVAGLILWSGLLALSLYLLARQTAIQQQNQS